MSGGERPIGLVRGTRDWLPDECARLVRLEAILVERFRRAGYDPLRTSVLEFTELHERKSGAGIVAKLFELAGQGQEGVCLRPELTAGIVRAYVAATVPPAVPWRVSHSGPVFRYETPAPDRLREFHQVGVERLGDGGPLADAEVIGLADWALAEAGVRDVTIRVGHVGLILELLDHSGLPPATRSALVEMLSEAATRGHNVQALDAGLEQLADWLRGAEPAEVPEAVERGGDSGIDRLFRTLVPVVTGRRSGHEIIHRLRRKWDLGHDLLGVLAEVRRHIHALADLKGRPPEVLDRLEVAYQALAPESIAALRALLRALEDHGIDPARVELDLGFGRGIGFYSQMIFELAAGTPAGPVEVGGGGRYDGLARVLGSDRDDRGVGFAIGLERLAQVLDAQGHEPGAIAPDGFLVLAEDSGRHPEAIRLARELRGLGARAVLDTTLDFVTAYEAAENLGLARLVVIRGPLEAPSALLVHDLVALTEIEMTVRQLLGQARADAGGRPS